MTKPITLQNQLTAARRELEKRLRCYPRWVIQGKLKQPVADYELAVQAAIIATLEKLVGLEETTAWMKSRVNE
jgi:hypothetical protein